MMQTNLVRKIWQLPLSPRIHPYDTESILHSSRTKAVSILFICADWANAKKAMWLRGTTWKKLRLRVCVFCSGRLGDSALKVAHTVIKLAVVSLASSQMSLTLPPISTHTRTCTPARKVQKNVPFCICLLMSNVKVRCFSSHIHTHFC